MEILDRDHGSALALKGELVAVGVDGCLDITLDLAPWSAVQLQQV